MLLNNSPASLYVAHLAHRNGNMMMKRVNPAQTKIAKAPSNCQPKVENDSRVPDTQMMPVSLRKMGPAIAAQKPAPRCTKYQDEMFILPDIVIEHCQYRETWREWTLMGPKATDRINQMSVLFVGKSQYVLNQVSPLGVFLLYCITLYHFS